MTRGPYTPQPGTIPAKVITYLQEQTKAGRQWIALAELEGHTDQAGLSPYLTIPIKRGALRKRAVPGNRRLTEYAIGDGTPPSEDNEVEEPLHLVPVPAAIAPAPPPWPPSSKAPSVAMPPKKASKYADIACMQITDDPITERIKASGDKYTDLFGQLKVGQAIKCRSADAPKVSNALRKWRDIHRPSAIVRAVRVYPTDGLGRVWLLAAKGERA